MSIESSKSTGRSEDTMQNRPDAEQDPFDKSVFDNIDLILKSQELEKNNDSQKNKSVMLATYQSRNDITDALNMIRDGSRRIEEETTYRYIYNSYKRMKESREFDATCTLLGIIGSFLTIGSAAHHFQSQTYTELQGMGKLFEQIGGGASRFTQAEQSEIQGLIERLQQMRQDAQRDDQEIDRILSRLDELFARQMKQFSETVNQMMRNVQ